MQKEGLLAAELDPDSRSLKHEWARRKEQLFAAAMAMRAAIEDFFARGMGENEQLTFLPFPASVRSGLRTDGQSRSRRRRAQFYSPGKFTTTYCGSRLSPLPSVVPSLAPLG